jgi:hypothetical protein
MPGQTNQHRMLRSPVQKKNKEEKQRRWRCCAAWACAWPAMGHVAREPELAVLPGLAGWLVCYVRLFFSSSLL